LDVLLKTPVVDKEIRLEAKVKSFAIEDPELEQLNEAQKHLLRMGPQNSRACRKKLKEIKEALKAKGLL
jgi:hypothetical protein